MHPFLKNLLICIYSLQLQCTLTVSNSLKADSQSIPHICTVARFLTAGYNDDDISFLSIREEGRPEEIYRDSEPIKNGLYVCNNPGEIVLKVDLSIVNYSAPGKYKLVFLYQPLGEQITLNNTINAVSCDATIEAVYPAATVSPDATTDSDSFYVAVGATLLIIGVGVTIIGGVTYKKRIWCFSRKAEINPNKGSAQGFNKETTEPFLQRASTQA